MGVGRSQSTCELPEQRQETVSGRQGGKVTDRGEHRADAQNVLVENEIPIAFREHLSQGR